jgi:hypothetical protein
MLTDIMERSRSSFKLPVNHINGNLHAGILNSLSLLRRRDGLCRRDTIPRRRVSSNPKVPSAEG